MSSKPRKLSLSFETLRRLSPDDLVRVAGGWIRRPLSWSCPQPSDYSSCRCVTEDQ
jgi:hypothetical protein